MPWQTCSTGQPACSLLSRHVHVVAHVQQPSAPFLMGPKVAGARVVVARSVTMRVLTCAERQAQTEYDSGLPSVSSH